jgi:hypothetical protein
MKTNIKTLILLSLTALSITANAYDGEIKETLFPKQWALKNNGQVILKDVSDLERVKVQGIPGVDINWIETGSLLAPKNELIVAVLDSGIDVDHPDLKGRLTSVRWNFLDGNINVADDMGHGTHVAGVIAANKNSMGIVGAADPRIKIMPIKVLSAQVSGFVYKGKLITDIIADAMIFAIQNGAQVINLSLGWPKLIDTAKVRSAFQMAEDKNVLVVAAAGNNNKDLPTFPCAYESVVCVGSIDNRGLLSDFSNHGSKVDVVAPGEYIVSTFPQVLESRVLRIKNYEVKRGSSQAAPFVTASLATLKLFNPDLGNDRARALLFLNSRALIEDNKHFVKFGMLDMKAMLNAAASPSDKSFLTPMLKNVTEIRFKKGENKFTINLPLKNISLAAFSGKVCAEIQAVDVSLDKPCVDLTLVNPGQKINLSFTGVLDNLNSDSHLVMKISIDDRSYASTIVFSRDLNSDSEMKVFPIDGAVFDDMGLINGERKLSKLTRVLDKFRRVDFPEYFFMERAKQTPTQTVISLLTKENGMHKIKTITLPLVNRVLSIHRQDINQDGELDYFIYALSANKDQLLFINLNKNLVPLFGKLSTWSFPLSAFEGLPIDGGLEKFDWVKLNHKDLGAILVPSFYKVFTMPELDNSKNILDRVIGQSARLFFMNPTVANEKVSVESRVLDSVSVINKLRSSLGLFSDQSLTLLKTIPQTKEQNVSGIVHALFSTSDESSTKFFDILFNDKTVTVNSLTTSMSVSDSLIYPVINSDDYILTTLLNRSSAEFLLLSQLTISSQATLKTNWENPIIAMIGAFNQSGVPTLLVENRSTVTLVKEGSPSLELPVYRDSSFPGQNFSETLVPILSSGRAAVYVNSTLIFGERLYIMVDDAQHFVRPMNLSVAIPEGCVPLAPETLQDRSSFNFTFLCRDPSGAVSLKFLPMLEN